MKETPNFQDVLEQTLFTKESLKVLLIGGLLMFVPIINFLSLGYLFNQVKAIRKAKKFVISPFADWGNLFVDGLKVFLIWIVLWGVPFIALYVIIAIIEAIGLGFLATILWCAGLATLSVFFAAALYRFSARERFSDLFDLQLIGKMAIYDWKKMVIPVLVFSATLLILGSLYGFALFTGFFLLLSFIALRYSQVRP